MQEQVDHSIDQINQSIDENNAEEAEVRELMPLNNTNPT